MQRTARLGTLADRHSDLTQRCILDAAFDLLSDAPAGELTMRAVAKRAGMSERTVFRYYASREELLDKVAEDVIRRISIPAAPSTIDELIQFPVPLYKSFEETASLTRAFLHSELRDRIRDRPATERWKAVRRLLDEYAPRRSEQDRAFATANIRYFLAATTWDYYRSYFRFSLPETIQAAQNAIRDLIRGLSGPT